MRRTLTAVLCLSLALIGCGGKESSKEEISEDLKKRGTTELMQEAANDEYTAPEDGRLTEAQVQMYLKVREHEKKIAQVAKDEMKQHVENAEQKGDKSLAGMMDGFKALGSAADLMTADIRAAKDLGYNSQEYLWIKGQILAASTAAMADQFNQAMTANFDQAYADAKKAYDAATDETTKKMYAEMLAGYDKTRQEMAQQAQSAVDDATAYNRKLLTKYENALKAFAHEMSKFENNDGDVQKSMEELEKAKTNAQQ